jgi:16S rRNA (cytosine1402-N4)-methyltransferase
MYHNPVLLNETVTGAVTRLDGVYADVTFGGGGHAREILNRLNENGKLFGFDQDEDAKQNIIDDPRFQFIASNFKYLKKFLQFYKAYPLDGILADLGVSSYQFDTPQRGFSHRFDDTLDMRMNNTKGLSAADVVNTYPIQRLAKMFYNYGEVTNSYKLAILIEKARETKPIETTGELCKILSTVLPFGKENKTLSQVFQAIRIEVNEEIEALQEFLTQSIDALKPGGRIAIISYHSLEDRLVKNFLKTGNLDGTLNKDFFGNPITPFKLISRKAIIPSENEIASNSRARSAKLRIAERIEYKK